MFLVLGQCLSKQIALLLNEQLKSREPAKVLGGLSYSTHIQSISQTVRVRFSLYGFSQGYIVLFIFSVVAIRKDFCCKRNLIDFNTPLVPPLIHLTPHNSMGTYTKRGGYFSLSTLKGYRGEGCSLNFNKMSIMS